MVPTEAIENVSIMNTTKSWFSSITLTWGKSYRTKLKWSLRGGASSCSINCHSLNSMGLDLMPLSKSTRKELAVMGFHRSSCVLRIHYCVWANIRNISMWDSQIWLVKDFHSREYPCHLSTHSNNLQAEGSSRCASTKESIWYWQHLRKSQP